MIIPRDFIHNYASVSSTQGRWLDGRETRGERLGFARISRIIAFGRAVTLFVLACLLSPAFGQTNGVAPSIVSQPTNQVAALEGGVSFQVVASGTPALAYQWQFSGTNLVDGGRISGSQNASLAISNVQTADIGNYQVLITNSYGSVTSAPAALGLYEMFLPVTNNLALWLRADLGVIANATGHVAAWADQSGAAHDAAQTVFGQQPLLITNGLGGQPLLRFNSAAGDYFNLNGQVVTSQQFTIFAVVSDTGTGTGNREVFSEWASTNGLTSVYFGTTQNNPVRARLTDYLYINGVGTVAQPAADFLYTGVAGATNALIFQNQNLIASTNTPLSPRILTSSYVVGRQGTDNGEYWQGDIAEILVYNAEMSASQRAQVWSYLLARYSQPVITSQPQSQTVAIGGSVVFSVAAPTVVSGTYQWLLNGVNLADNGRIAGSQSNILVFTNVATSDAGGYQVIVSNAYGSAISAVATLTVVPQRSLTWNGLPNGNWDTASPDWLNATNATSYDQGDLVTFDDTLAGTATVNLTTSLRPASLMFNNSLSNYVFSGAGSLAGPLGLVKNGSGSVTLAGTGGDSFAGGVAVNSGRLVLDDAKAILSGGAVVAAAGTLQIGRGDANGSLPTGNVTLNGTLNFSRSDSVTVPNVIAGAGTGTLIQSNSSVLTVSGNNTGFTGAVMVAQGTLKIGGANALGTRTNALVTVKSGATLDFGGIAGSNSVVVSGSGVGGNGALVNSGAAQVSALQSITLGANTVFGGSGRWDLRGPPAALLTGGQPFKITKVGANQISLVAVATIDPALGDIDIQQGEFAIQTTTGQVGNPTNTITVHSNAILDVWNLNSSPLNKRILLNDGATVYNESGYSVIIGPVTLNTNNAGGAGNATFLILSGTTLFVNGPISGPGNLVKTGASFSYLYVNGTNTYTGSTLVNNGTLSLSTSGSISDSANITIAAGAVLDASGRPDQTLTLTSGQVLQGNGTVDGDLAASAGSMLMAGSLNSIGELAVSGILNLQGATVVKLNGFAGSNDLFSASNVFYGGILSVTNLAGSLANGNSFKLFDAESYSGAFASILPVTPGNGLVWDTSLLDSDGVLGVLAPNALAIYQQPQAFAQIYAGGNITFSIVAGSAAPISYQWSFNGTVPIPGATNAILTLNAVQLTDAGSYACTVSNQFGSLTSSNAVLAVLPAGNTCLPPPPGLVDWWTGDGNATDILSGNNGTLMGNVSFTNGEVGQAFDFEGTNGFVSTSLLVTNPQSFSLSLWFRTATTKGGVLLGFGDSRLGTAANYDRNVYIGNAGAIHFGVWTGAYQLIGSATGYNDDNWHQVVASLSASAGLSLYVDGALAANDPAVNSAQIYNGWWRIGENNLGGWPFQPSSYYFSGQIDEVTIFNRALSSSEVEAIYASGTAGMCLPSGVQPVIVTEPTNQNVVESNSVTFSVAAIGAMPLAYQWQFDGTNLTDGANLIGSQGTNLTILGALPSNAGNYQVIVANNFGSVTSVVASLSVRILPVITAQPQSQVSSAGSSVTFSVAAAGSPPLSYQWLFDGTNLTDGDGISGSQSTNLTIADVLLSNAGSYSVIVANPFGSTNSVSAELSVVGPLTNGPGAVAPPPGMVDWWPAEGNANDLAGTNNGTPFGELSYGPGEVGLTFQFDGSTSYINTGASNLPPPWTASFWVNRQDATDNSAALLASPQVSSNGYALKLEQFNRTRQVGITHYGAADYSFGYIAPTGTWVHLVFVGTSNSTALYTNGSFQGSISVGIPLPRTYIGAGFLSTSGVPFLDRTRGSVDEISLFDRALSDSEISALYSAGNAGLYVGPVPPTITTQPQNQAAAIGSGASFYVTATGVAPLSYQWLFNGTNLYDSDHIAGSQNAYLAIVGVSSSDAGNYQVFVTNAFGSATSSVAVLNAGTPPSIVTQPQSQAAAIGSNVAFSVSATGTAPLNYQWQFNAADLDGATGSSFDIPNAAVGNSGNYSVIVTNDFGSVTSSNATLTVYTRPAILQQPISAEVAVGGSAVFRVVASSSAPLNYQWIFDGTNITSATNSTYNVVNAQLTDAGSYSVLASSLAGSIVSSNATLIVVVPPPPPPPPPSYTLNLLPGLNLIANQLNNGGNTLDEIMPVVPDGTLVSKYVNTNGIWLQSVFDASSGVWVPDNITLSPGEGAFLDSPSNYSLTLTGRPQATVLPVVIPDGVAYLLSRQTNDVGTYENIVGSAPTPGAVVFKWVNAITNYATYTYSATGWVGGIEPTAAVGESMFIGSNGGSPVPITQPPSITQQPASLTVGQGDSAVFGVTATGSQPLYYQWLQNANQIPGATNSSLTIRNVQATNAGTYSVAVNNSIGITNSAIVSLVVSNIVTLPFSDDFADAGSLGSATNGAGFGSNVGATLEPGEPNPTDIQIGASVWVQWHPQFSGIANFTTAGSGFATVLAVYTGSSLSDLALVGADVGIAPFLWGSVGFNAVAGTTYYIQVSGSYAATGTIALSWNLAVTANQVPVITSQPQSQSVPPGATVTLSVGLQDGGPFVYQWLHGNVPLSGATDATLTLSNVDFSQGGFYSVQVTDPQSQESVTSAAGHLSVVFTGPGFPGNSAFISGQDNLQSATALTPPDPNIVGDPAPAGGYTGAINDGGNTLASAQLGEPNHCSFPACHSVWYSYVSPANGLLSLSVYQNNFNALLAVYTGPGTNFASLVPVACNANQGAAGQPVTVTFPDTAGETNWIVVDGVNCSSGSYVLGWTNASPPALSLQPVGQILAPGSRLALSTASSGTPPMNYQWQLNGTNIPGANASSFALQNFQPANAGGYQVVIANTYGAVTSLTATVTTTAPLSISATSSPVGAGSISGTGDYSAGQIVTLVATPNECYSFANWTENGVAVSTNATYAFTAIASRNLTANFALNTCIVTVSSVGGGTTSGGGTYNCGATVTVTATPNSPGLFFSMWTVGGTNVSTNSTYSFTVTNSVTLVAHFGQGALVTVLANPAIGGTALLKGSITGTTNFTTLPVQPTISARPNDGWAFADWMEVGPASGLISTLNTNRLSITAAGSYIYTANFVPTNIVLSIGSPAFSGNGLNLEIAAPLGTSYRVDVSTDLMNWLPLTSFTVVISPFPFNDAAAGSQSQRFYRAVWLP